MGAAFWILFFEGDLIEDSPSPKLRMEDVEHDENGHI